MNAPIPHPLLHPALLLFGLAQAPGLAQGQEIPPLAAPAAAAIARDLEVQKPDTPWKLTAVVDGKMVQLDLPNDQFRVAALPIRAQRAVNFLRELHPENLARIAQAASITGRKLEQTRLFLKPEHQQHLREVALTVSPRFGSEPRVLHRYEPILRALPGYTEVNLFVPGVLLDRVKRELKELRLHREPRLHPVPVYLETPMGLNMIRAPTPWARDQAEVVSASNGAILMLLPLAHKQTYDLNHRDNEFVYGLEDIEMSVLPVPLFFKSGNLLMVDGRSRILFVGEEEVEHNEIGFLVSTGRKPPRAAVLALLKRLTGADVVEVVPNSPQFFHLDMMVAAVRPGTVALLSPLEGEVLEPRDAAALAALRGALERHDIRVFPIPTVARRVAAFQSPANAVPFLDPQDLKPSALVPRFPDVEVRVNGTRQSLNGLVEAAYRRAGVKVLPVEDRFSDLHGNIHCVIMTLS
ncbi:MAG TPA: hypothetical protein VF104_00820 [Burkholderiales bacterium]